MQFNRSTANKTAVVCLLTVLVLVSLFGISATNAKYVNTVSHSVTIEVLTASVVVDPMEAIGWLEDNLYNTSSKLGEYWASRLNTNSALDSTGGNYGVYVCDEIMTAFSLPELNFSFAVYHYTKTVSGVKNNYFTIYFVNTYIGNLDISTTVADIYRYKTEDSSVTIGTATLLTKYVTVGGVNQLMNYLNLSSYTVTSTVA